MPFADREVCRFVDMFHAFNRRVLPFVPLRPARTPQCRHIGCVHRIDEISGNGIAAMGDRIDLHRACRRLVPWAGADRNERMDGAWAGRAFPMAWETNPPEPPDLLFHRAKAHGKELVCRFGRVLPLPAPLLLLSPKSHLNPSE